MTDPTTPDASSERGELNDAMKRGLKWSALNMVVAKLASILSGIVLARILIPEDYGVFAPAMAVVYILFGLNDLGLLLALVRWKGDLEQAARTAQTLAMGFSAGLYVLCFVGAPWFATTMGSPDSAAVLRVLALTVFIDGVTTVAHGLLVRDFMQDRFAKAEFAALPVGIISAVVLALAGAGVWALVISQILSNCVTGVMLLRASPMRLGFGFDWRVAKPMLSYGLPLALTSLVEYCLLNADYLIVSRALGPAAVGIYLLAFNVSNWPVSIITEGVRRVSIAGFARMEGEEDTLRRGFGKAFSVLMAVALPLLAALGVFALPLISFLYGEQWIESASVLEILVVLTGARMAIGFIFDLLVGVGRTRTTLALKCVWLVLLVAALEIGVRAGELRGVAVAHAIVASVVALPLFLRAAAQAGADLGDVLRRMARPLLAVIPAIAVGLAVRDSLGGPGITMFVGGAILVTVYLLLAVRPSELVKAAALARQDRAGLQSAVEEEVAEASALVGQDPALLTDDFTEVGT